MKTISTEIVAESLDAVIAGAGWLLPELMVALTLFIIVIADFIVKQKKDFVLSFIAVIGLVAAFVFLCFQWQQPSTSKHIVLFGSMLHLDGLAIYLRMLFVLATLLSIFFSFKYSSAGIRLSSLGEYFVMILSLLLGAMLMSMATNMLMIYISIELVSISSYILTNFSFSRKSAEAGLKYLLFGAVASGIMLYGMSLLYGFTGTLNLTSIEFKIGLLSLNIEAIPLLIAGFLTLGGFLFKISSVPFHIWAPDVYEGAPIPVVALFSVVPKIAGFAILIRYLHVFDSSSILFVSLNLDWRVIVAVIAGITMFVGNLAALWQDNPKRMLAYSSIAHSGFLLAGVAAFSRFGIHTILFYASIYLLMNFAAFLIVNILSKQSGKESIRSYSGMAKNYPYLAACMVVVMIALVGLPPTAGFSAKFLIFSALYETYQLSNNISLLYLLLVGVLNTVVALVYYLKIPYFMYFKSSNEDTLASIGAIKVGEWLLLGILIIPLLLFFFKADWLLDIIDQVKYTF